MELKRNIGLGLKQTNKQKKRDKNEKKEIITKTNCFNVLVTSEQYKVNTQTRITSL